MSVANILYDDLVKEIDKLQEDDHFSEDGRWEVVPPPIIEHVPPFNVYMDPDPDVLEKEHPRQGGKPLLGVYYPMRSPGKIVLFRNNLHAFFWSLFSIAFHQGVSITKKDMRAGLWLVILQTYSHEKFHYYCDVLHKLFGGEYVALKDEAFAVAWSRLRILRDRKDKRTSISNMDSKIFELIIDHAYRFTSPGYRDWVKYKDEGLFKKGFGCYINPPNYDFLQQSNVLIDDLLLGMMEKINPGFDEAIG
mgnify:CR=1 FL=1